jgi:hypothetical protein
VPEYRVQVVISTTTTFDVVADDEWAAEWAAVKLADQHHGMWSAKGARAIYQRDPERRMDGWRPCRSAPVA